MPDQSTNRGTTHCAQCTASGEHGTCDTAHRSSRRGILLTVRHARTTGKRDSTGEETNKPCAARRDGDHGVPFKNQKSARYAAQTKLSVRNGDQQKMMASMAGSSSMLLTT